MWLFRAMGVGEWWGEEGGGARGYGLKKKERKAGHGKSALNERGVLVHLDKSAKPGEVIKTKERNPIKEAHSLARLHTLAAFEVGREARNNVRPQRVFLSTSLYYLSVGEGGMI